MQIETVPIDSISPDPANVRKHPEKNLDAIKSSLRRFGQQKPIVVDGNGIVRAGNGTLEAAKALGWTEIGIVRTALKGSEATAFSIADNRSADLSSFELGDLGSQLASLECDGIPPIDLGWSSEEFEQLTHRFEPREVEPPAMPEGEKAPFRQATFTVHDEQWTTIASALARAKLQNGGKSELNENSNGNALAFICSEFLQYGRS